MFIIRRPAVWIAIILIILYTGFSIISKDEIYKKQYVLDEMFTDNSKIQTTLYGCYDSSKESEKTICITLKDIYLYFDDAMSTEKYLPAINIYVNKDNMTINEYKPGNKLKCHVSLMEINSASNPGEFDLKKYYHEKNIYYTAICTKKDISVTDSHFNFVKTQLYAFREKIKQVYIKCIPKKEAGIVSSMMLGDKSMLDDEIKELYQQNGISHLLAISGMYITILCMALSKFFSYIKTPDKISIILTIIFLILYGTMTGFSVSTSRAVIMMIFALIAKLSGRSYDTLSALALSAVIIVLQKPAALFSCNFLLSFGAIISIAVVYPFLKVNILNCENNLIHTKNESIFKYLTIEIKNLLLISFSIQLFTLPVILFFYYEIPLYGFCLNLIIIPLSGILVILSALGGLSGVIILPVGKFIMGAVYSIIKLYEISCKICNNFPFHTILTGQPRKAKILFYYIVLITSIFIIKKLKDFSYIKEPGISKHYFSLLYISNKNKKGSIAFLIVLVLLYIFMLIPVNNKKFSINFLDVGQGDCIIIKNESGNIYMIDGGSSSKDNVGKYIIKPYLKYYGIRKIDYCIITHSDSDHISGIIELLNENSNDKVKIKNFFLPNPDDAVKDDTYYEVLKSAKKKCDSVKYINKCDIFTDQKLKITCIHPEAKYKADSANAYSTVLSILHGNISCLLTGDVENDGEKQILKFLNDNRNKFPEHYTLLKVAHHGSKNSSSNEFLKCIMPDIAVISCGKNNRYGHPHAELLERLDSADAKIVRTDEGGAVTISADREERELFLNFYNANCY